MDLCAINNIYFLQQHTLKVIVLFCLQPELINTGCELRKMPIHFGDNKN